MSHANKKNQPKGATAEQIRYDAMVKIQVSQFRAKANSRYGGGEVLTIWEDGAMCAPVDLETQTETGSRDTDPYLNQQTPKE